MVNCFWLQLCPTRNWLWYIQHPSCRPTNTKFYKSHRWDHTYHPSCLEHLPATSTSLTTLFIAHTAPSDTLAEIQLLSTTTHCAKEEKLHFIARWSPSKQISWNFSGNPTRTRFQWLVISTPVPTLIKVPSTAGGNTSMNMLKNYRQSAFWSFSTTSGWCLLCWTTPLPIVG